MGGRPGKEVKRYTVFIPGNNQFRECKNEKEARALQIQLAHEGADKAMVLKPGATMPATAKPWRVEESGGRALRHGHGHAIVDALEWIQRRKQK